MSWLWHGFNWDPMKRRRQCFYEWHCFVCWLRLMIRIIRLGLRRRRLGLL